MFAEIGVLAAGVIPGRMLRRSARAHKAIGRSTMLTIYALLFILGAKLGGDAEIFESFGHLGVQGITLGFACTMGSAVCVRLAQRFFRDSGDARQTANRNESADGKPHSQQGTQDAQPDSPSTSQAGQAANFIKGISGSLIILGCFFLGMFLSRTGILPGWLYGGDVSLYLLWAMLFCVGMGVGFDLGSLLIVREMGFRVMLVPLLTVIGTAIGGVVCFLFLDLDLHSCLIVASGLGYYSLSSVIVTEMGGAMLGSIALLANVFRELFSLVATPLLVRLFGPLSPGAAAGAPAMDTCLPVIVHFTSERYAIVALFNGLVMTMLVPFLVPLVMSL